jgi:signal transduction histidine kinase
MMVLLVAVLVVEIIAVPPESDLPRPLALVVLGVFALIYTLSRSRLYLAGAGLIIAMFLIAPYMILLSTDGIASGNAIIWTLVSILLTAILLSRRVALIVSALALAAPLAVIALSPEAAFLSYANNYFLLLAASVLVQVFSNQRDLIEADRQSDLQHLNAALEQSAREANEANRLKDLFLATMSHELRTPLNAIIGFLGLLLYKEKLDPDDAHMVERSMVNAERLLGLINNLLELSRVTAGRLEITPVDMQPRRLAETLRGDLELAVKEKNLELYVSVDNAIPQTIYHDEERLLQIVTNLVNNAIKFTEKGMIEVAFQRIGDRMQIDVTDSGIGIPLAKQEIIFDEFMQADTGYSRKFGGAGLGLAIVKRLTSLMGGTVRVRSEVGQGSTFTVEVPLQLARKPRGTGTLAGSETLTGSGALKEGTA